MYLVSYDISDNRLRTKIAKKCEAYGTRIQYSVFKCDLSKPRFKKLYSELLKLSEKYEMDEGSIIFFNICEKCMEKTAVIGTPEPTSRIGKDDVLVV